MNTANSIQSQAATHIEHGRMDAAITLLSPNRQHLDAEGLRLLILAFRGAGRLSEALEVAEPYALGSPLAEPSLLWALTAVRGQAWDLAIRAVHHGLTRARAQTDPITDQLMMVEAFAVSKLNQPHRSVEVSEGWYRAFPSNPRSAIAYVGALMVAARISEALEIARSATERFPQEARVWNLRASCAQECGAMEEAYRCHHVAFDLDPHPAHASNILYASQFITSLDEVESEQQHSALCERLWGRSGMRSERAIASAGGSGAGERRIRIGFLSPDFRYHSVAAFAEPLIESLDRNRFEIFCYSNVTAEDQMTHRFRALSDHWRDLTHWPDDQQAAREVAKDDLDLLIDLAGHTGGNRLGIFPWRPARWQVTWLGYPDITGLAAMDARLADGVVDPIGGTLDLHPIRPSEAIIRLPMGYHCWRPVPECPPVQPLAEGAPVMGCFGTLTKLNDGVFDLWAEILRREPSARLLLKAKPLADQVIQDRIRGAFIQRGIDGERLDLLARIEGQQGHLGAYGRLHLALDTFPYNGTTTLCEALWMGVPVLTLRGQRRVARVGESVLHALDPALVESLVAPTPESYVERAVRFLRDRSWQQIMRDTLRSRMQQSHLRDEQGFARAFEEAILRLIKGD